MVRLAKSTYQKVRESVLKHGLCTQVEHDSDECHICCHNTVITLRWLRENKEKLWDVWCLCDHHQREIDILW